MFHSLNTYHIFVRENEAHAYETLETVQDRFNWLAFLFPFFWALYHRIWWLAALSIGVIVGLELLVQQALLTETTVAIITLGLQLLVGFEAADIRTHQLNERGYHFAGIVTGHNEVEAQQRFLDQNHKKFDLKAA